MFARRRKRLSTTVREDERPHGDYRSGPGEGGRMSLSIHDYQILDFLSEDGGFLTRRVALKAGGGVGRKQSAWTRQSLLSLKARGLVIELDDQKPVCWKRTKQGTAALADGIARGIHQAAPT